jgi:hypothetical protein
MQYQAQQVNSFMPPTRASQGLKPTKSVFSKNPNNMQIVSSGKIKPKLDFSFDDKQDQILQQYTEQNEVIQEQYDEEENKSFDEVAPGEYTPNPKIQINKVNEMDIKVSRFDKKNEYGYEEIIPNEEPLIQIR